MSKAKRIAVTFHPEQEKLLRDLMEQDKQYNITSYFVYLINQEIAHRKGIVKNPVGRPKKKQDQDSESESAWVDPIEEVIAKYDDEKLDIEHPDYMNHSGEFTTERGYYRFMINWKGWNVDGTHNFGAPTHVEREDYTLIENAPSPTAQMKGSNQK